MNNETNWIIHLVMNGVPCDDCGKVEDSFLPFTCNCHTHGMEQFDHLNFQIVLKYPKKEIGRILNTLGLRVKNGEKFKDGDLIEGIYEDCPVMLKEFDECERKVLRVIIPDKWNHFPKDKDCSYPYFIQALPTDMLLRENFFKYLV